MNYESAISHQFINHDNKLNRGHIRITGLMEEKYGQYSFIKTG
jgi:hypothetical protein